MYKKKSTVDVSSEKVITNFQTLINSGLDNAKDNYIIIISTI